jgi:hypothetical protein
MIDETIACARGCYLQEKEKGNLFREKGNELGKRATASLCRPS